MLKPSNVRRIILIPTLLFIILIGAFVVKAGGIDNFKLQYYKFRGFLQASQQDLLNQPRQPSNSAQTARIDLDELLNGGPPKDGIPSIDSPVFDTAETTPFSDDELVIGIIINGQAKAYPLGIMNWHEIVNDTLSDINLTVSYCPLCDTVVAFKRGQTTYGVSGKLYQSCLVMYSRDDETLYAQPWGLGIMGNKVNQPLERIPASKTTLGAWLNKYPSSAILSPQTGHQRNYQRYPYGTYYTDEQIIFPARHQEKRQLHPKAIISYIWSKDNQTPKNHFSGSSYQFPHQELEKIGEKIVTFNGRKIKAYWDEELKTVIVQEMDGTILPNSTAFAFVYPAFFLTDN